MQIFITDLSKIRKKSLFLSNFTDQLSSKDKKRFDDIKAQERKLQFLAGRLMIYRFLGKDFQVEKSGKLTSEKAYLSLTHSKNIVALALAKTPIGIDAEYILKKRKYQEICNFLHLGKCHCKQDFYKLFTQYEADYKKGKTTSKTEHIFFMWKKYLICVSCSTKKQVSIYEFFPMKLVKNNKKTKDSKSFLESFHKHL